MELTEFDTNKIYESLYFLKYGIGAVGNLIDQGLLADATLVKQNLTKEEVEKSEIGIRFDTGKLRYDLIPVEPLTAYAAIMTMGAKKYADSNWLKGMKWSRITASIWRHWAKWMAGEKLDKESGYPHLWHMLWNVAALITYEARNIGDNDIMFGKDLDVTSN